MSFYRRTTWRLTATSHFCKAGPQGKIDDKYREEMNIVARPLNALKAVDYLARVLEHVAVLDSDTAHYHRTGSMVGLAPLAASAERMHDFVHAGLLPRQAPTSVATLRVEPVFQFCSKSGQRVVPASRFGLSDSRSFKNYRAGKCAGWRCTPDRQCFVLPGPPLSSI